MAAAALLKSLRRRETAVLLRSLCRREIYTAPDFEEDYYSTPDLGQSRWIPDPDIFPIRPPRSRVEDPYWPTVDDPNCLPFEDEHRTPIGDEYCKPMGDERCKPIGDERCTLVGDPNLIEKPLSRYPKLMGFYPRNEKPPSWYRKPMISYPPNPTMGVTAVPKVDSMPACSKRSNRKADARGCHVIGIDLGTKNSYVVAAEGKNPIGIEKMEMVPYKIAGAPNAGDAWVELEADGQQYSPSEIGASILTEMKGIAETYLKRSVNKAVVTVPAYFNDVQQQAIKDDARAVGLDVQGIILKPIAAALSCGMNEKEGLVAVFELGGETFDISILKISNGVFELKATNGDASLGGVDFDNALFEFLVSEFERTEGIDLWEDRRAALERLRQAGVMAKIDLSSTSETKVNVPFITLTNHLKITLTRRKFEALVNHLTERIKAACERCLKDAGVSEVDEVLLVGGMTRVPKIQEVVSEIFGKSPSKVVNPDRAVFMGAVIEQIE